MQIIIETQYEECKNEVRKKLHMIKTYNLLHKYDLHICTVCIRPIARESLGWLHFG